MSITGGTFFLNALSLEYPIIEWTETALSFCDEIILIDMGSVDGTRRALRTRFGNKINIITEKWRFEKNYHEGIPRNKILYNASSDWIFLSDSDEIVHEQDFNKLRQLTDASDVMMYRFPITTFYGSCYVTYHASNRIRFALIRKDPKFNFGPLRNKKNAAPDSLKYGAQIAHKRIHYKVSDVDLLDYGRCRSPKARLRSVDFFVKQQQARWGWVPQGDTKSEQDFVIPYPDFTKPIFKKWLGHHPNIMQEWTRKHWKSHGWAI